MVKKLREKREKREKTESRLKSEMEKEQGRQTLDKSQESCPTQMGRKLGGGGRKGKYI